MVRKILHIILISIIPLITFSQDQLSKQEIYSYCIEIEKDINEADGYKTRFDSLVVNLINNLKSSGIDTIGAYAEEYVGSYTLDSCQCGIIPWVSYVNWIKNGKIFHQKITECCEFKPIIIENSVLIRYYINGRTKIDQERIMPIITGASTNKEGEFIFEMETIDHTTHYSIYCSVNGSSRFTTFEEYELENKNNIFYDDNINSMINSWRKMIEDQIAEIESE